VRELREKFGATIFLTTQYLEEADHLADRVAIINRGLIVREGTPAALKAEVGADVIDIAVGDHECGAARVAILDMQSNGELPAGEVRGTETGYTLFVPNGASNIAALVRGLDRAGVSTGPISVSRPSLDDVFLAATGGRLQASAESQPSQDGERVPTGQGVGR
jgi:ABC-2 type transport system ATP-binding protein